MLTFNIGLLIFQKLANSLDTHIRQNISSFVDAVEEVLMEQLQLDLRVGDNSG